MAIHQTIDRLQDRVNTLARFVHVFSGTLDAPMMEHPQRGFRYHKPDHRHFVLLRACRVVSTLNAAIVLARSGYPQEIGVLHRVVKESTSQIGAVMTQISADGKLNGPLAEFIVAYFKDSERSEDQKPSPQPKLSQKYINELIGAELDPFSQLKPGDPGWKSAADRHWHLDWVFSNYVHGRYPETMDLYGGRPGHFHLHGMKGTPKDPENIMLIDELITSSSFCFIRISQTFNLDDELKHDPKLVEWRRKLGVS